VVGRKGIVLVHSSQAKKPSQPSFTISCFSSEEEEGYGNPIRPTSFPDNYFPPTYPIVGVHRTIKSSRKQKVLLNSYPLLIPSSTTPPSFSGKRLPGSRLSVLETLPFVSTPFQYHASLSSGLELQSPDIGSPDDGTDSSGEDSPIQTQAAFEAHEHCELEPGSHSVEASVTTTTPQFHGGLVSPPIEVPLAPDFYENYRDQTTDHLALHAEYERLEQASLKCEVANSQDSTPLAEETQDPVNRPYVTLEEDIFKYLDEEIMDLYEGGPSGHDNPYVRDPTRSDPFDAEQEYQMAVASPTFPDVNSLDTNLLDFYYGRGFPPDQAFDEDLFALYEGREEDTIEPEWDVTSDDYPLDVDLQEIASGPPWSLSPPLYNTFPLQY
jgi:hypothetical protein